MVYFCLIVRHGSLLAKAAGPEGASSSCRPAARGGVGRRREQRRAVRMCAPQGGMQAPLSGLWRCLSPKQGTVIAWLDAWGW